MTTGEKRIRSEKQVKKTANKKPPIPKSCRDGGFCCLLICSDKNDL